MNCLNSLVESEMLYSIGLTGTELFKKNPTKDVEGFHKQCFITRFKVVEFLNDCTNYG